MTSLAGDLTVAVVGLGVMGRGIARVFAAAGATVRVADATADDTVHNVARLHDEAAVDGRPAAVTAATTDVAAAEDADLVVEAILEDADAKRRLLERLAAAVPERCIVASNTSSLSIGVLGRAFGDPTRVVGMHFFNPPTKMRLVEVVRGSETSDGTVATAVAITEALGKTAVVCADSPNFVVNRVCRPLYYESELLVAEGVEPARVDAIARAALGHRVGPLELLDHAGLHTHLASSETAWREFGDPRYRPIPLVRRLVRDGHVGRAAARGFYDYDHETPRQARARVTRAPVEGGDRVTVRVEGPASGRLLADDAVAAVVAADATCLLYAGAAEPEAAAAVRAFGADGHDVIVLSSDGGWLDALPPRAGWMRLHLAGAGPFAEVVRDPVAGVAPPDRLYALLDDLGAASVEVPALPGLVADRLESCLVNEAVAVVEEGTAEPDAVDTAMRLGMNHPAGPFEVLGRRGPLDVLEQLRALQRCTGDPRYRPAQLLRRQAAGSRPR